ncbi:FeoA family protein [Croceicoccus mobilis]|nr:FeoA family protein [Croceicoccus mobilis]
MTNAGDSMAGERLADCELGTSVRILAVDWDHLGNAEARRLRALGFDVGAVLRLAHRGVFGGRDPIAIEVGRMTVALRRHHASAIMVEAAPDEGLHPAGQRPASNSNPESAA